MLRRCLIIALLLALPGVCLGQDAERYLSAGSQLYIRWDGVRAQRAAFDRTAMGQTLKGETGKFLAEAKSQLKVYLEPALAKLDELDQDSALLVKQSISALGTIGKNGFSMSLAVSRTGAKPPDFETVFVFPGAAGPKSELESVVKKIVDMSGRVPEKVKINNVAMQQVALEPIQWAFAVDGDLAIMIVGTVNPADIIRRGSDKGNNITKNPLHRQVRDFKEFPVVSCGYVDVASLAKLASSFSPEAAKLVDDAGLKSVKSLTFHSGYDGLAHRLVADLDIPGPRKGLVLLTKGRKIDLSELPPLPHDLDSFSARTINAPLMYDAALQLVEGAVRIYSAELADAIKAGVKSADVLTGVKIREDILESMGDLLVTYNSRGESPFLGLGGVTLVKLNNEKKFLAGMEGLYKVYKAFPTIPGVDVKITKRTYRGVDLIEVHTGADFDTPTYAIYKGWLVIANYPQPVYGFIMRSNGDLPHWKIDATTTKALTAFPKDFTSISYHDPRPGIESLLSGAPAVMSAVNLGVSKLLPDAKPFDVGSIPHPREATRLLFPTITTTTDDGTRIRLDRRSSIALPF